ncbi:MAG: GrpB family protein [Rhodothermaceae bacterium]
MKKNLGKLSNKELGQLFPVIIEEYNPAWSDIFTEEKNKIADAFDKKQIIRIEHIGSTAVKNLSAKPTIDILFEINEFEERESFIDQFQKLGYRFISRPENPAPGMMFVKGYTDEGFKGQAFHIHVRYEGNWNEIHFRDYLRAHPEVAAEYEKLKLKMAERFRNDREAYTESKTDFITKINKLARTE